MPTRTNRRTRGDRFAEVQAHVKALTPDMLHCRDYRHSWFPLSAVFRAGYYDEVIQCVRCGSRIHRICNRDGEVISRTHQYADGYLFKGVGRLTADDRAQLRLASIMDSVRTVGAGSGA